jgi:hypothetical protein
MGIGNMDKLQLKIEIRHKSNWHNETVRASRRSKFMCALVLALRKVPIYCPGGGTEPLGGPANPGYSVAVSDAWAAEARDQAGQKKESKRLVPTTTTQAPPGDKQFEDTLSPETAAAAALNARRPTLDTAHEDMTRRGSSRSMGNDTAARDESPDTKRSTEIDSLRNDLIHRKSTRGRRKRGETAPSHAAGPSLSITHASSTTSPRQDTYPPRSTRDEEAELGIHELSGQPSAADLDYDSYRAPYQAGGQAYARYPPGADERQLLPGQGSQQSRMQRLNLGLGSAEDKEEEFV